MRFQSDDRYITAANPDDLGKVSYSDTTPVAGVMFHAGDTGLALDLVPTRSRNMELGVKWQSSWAVSLDAALFRADTDDELATARNSGGRSSFAVSSARCACSPASTTCSIALISARSSSTMAMGDSSSPARVVNGNWVRNGGSDSGFQRHRRAMSESIPEQVLATPAALDLIERLRAKHGALLFHQSGGCCDGSSPMCYPVDDFIVGERDVKLGEIGMAAFYISPSQFEYWKHTQLIIDVVEGRGGMFSLENGEGVRFLVRSRLFTDEEYAALQVAGKV